MASVTSNVKLDLRFDISKLKYPGVYVHVASNGHLGGIWGHGSLHDIRGHIWPLLNIMASITFATILLWPLSVTISRSSWSPIVIHWRALTLVKIDNQIFPFVACWSIGPLPSCWTPSTLLVRIQKIIPILNPDNLSYFIRFSTTPLSLCGRPLSISPYLKDDKSKCNEVVQDFPLKILRAHRCVIAFYIILRKLPLEKPKVCCAMFPETLGQDNAADGRSRHFYNLRTLASRFSLISLESNSMFSELGKSSEMRQQRNTFSI